MKRKRFLVVLAAALGFGIGLVTVLRADEIAPESLAHDSKAAACHISSRTIAGARMDGAGYRCGGTEI